MRRCLVRNLPSGAVEIDCGNLMIAAPRDQRGRKATEPPPHSRKRLLHDVGVQSLR